MAKKQIDQELKRLENMQTLVQTYEEIAASRMQKVKTSVLTNRDYLAGLGEIFAQVKFSYEREIGELHGKSKDKAKLSMLGRNGKTISVLLSANTGLYGDIVRKTFDKFLEGIKDKDTDIAVVGRVGKGMYDGIAAEKGLKNYKYFDLSDSTSDPEDFRELISYIVEYEKVTVYHGQFESILTQIPAESHLTGQMALGDQVVGGEQLYIFEPTLPAIVAFFESQILASIFEQSLHESSLSKYASRMINLDKAVVNIGGRLKKTQLKAQLAKHQNMNKKQLSLISSMSLWN